MWTRCKKKNLNMCLADLAAGSETTLKPTAFSVIICCDTEFKKLYGEIFHSDGNKPTTRKISVLTLNGRHAPVIPLDTPCLTLPSPPLSLSLSLSPFLSLPSYPTFPSHPWGVLCATAETTDGAQHHPEREREGERE